jgi:2-amino-4-hydroxy-6-hydroxymethyldihydropteridine diphosphokinase
MSTAVLSIGSNVGDRLGYLQSAVDAMRRWLRAVSPVYETEPWGPVAQDDYLNAVLLVADANAGPADWLDRARAAERAAGRTRETHWGPRTLDVDVVAVDDFRSDDPDLTLPHPRAAQRAFVLAPWLAVDPDARLGERAVRDLLAELPSAGVRPRPDLAVA